MRSTTVPEAVVLVSEPLEDEAVGRWERLIGDAADIRPRQLVVDLQAVDRIDESAVVMLLRTHRRIMLTDGRLVVRGAQGRVRDMLRHGRVDSVLDVEEDWSRSA